MKIDRTLLLIGIIVFSISASGILFPVARKILLCVLLLAFGGVLAGNSEEEPRNYKIILGIIVANSQQVLRYYAESTAHTEPKSGYKFFEVIIVTLERSTFMVNGKTHKYQTFQTDPFGTPLEKPQNRDMKDGDLASAIWRLYDTHVIE
ncbi:MAG TPA: hypothetical protein VE344_08690 [Methylomirabilota bacterium]|nr:hypothetical protein [Methylomirabilota bacterium]